MHNILRDVTRAGLPALTATLAMVGCASPAIEQVSTQAIGEAAATTYRFSGALAASGDTCQKPFMYRDSLCGTAFQGYLTIPSTGTDGYYEAPYDDQGHVIGPYGMVLYVNGMSPRVFPYASVSIANDVPHPFDPNATTLIDTFHVAASANYSNDGFDASFMDPTGTAIDSVELMPDPALFSDVCWDSSGGCPLVVGGAAADFTSMNLELHRSPVVVPVPNDARDNAYFYITSADWSDTDHTTAAFTVEIFDANTFATPTCDLWVQLEDGDAGSPRAVHGIVRHDGFHKSRTVLSISTGAANSARRIVAANVTCTFALPGETTNTTNTTIWY